MPRFATASQGLIEPREIGCVAHLILAHAILGADLR